MHTTAEVTRGTLSRVDGAFLDGTCTDGEPCCATIHRFQKLRELLCSGKIGAVKRCSYKFCNPHIDPSTADSATPSESIPWRVRAAVSGAGQVLDVGSHAIDIIEFLLGSIRDVSGTAVNYGSPGQAVEDKVSGHFMAGATAVEVAWDFAVPPEEAGEWLTFEGEKGTIQTTVLSATALSITMDGADEPETISFDDIDHQHMHLQAQIVRDIAAWRARRGHEATPKRGRGQDHFLWCESTGESALSASAALDVMLESYYGSRVSDVWDREDSWPGNPRAQRK